LAVNSLFYSLQRIKFILKADGSVELDYQSIFSPIMQFTYGMDGYDWHFMEVMICEIMFSVVFAFFVYKKVSQLILDRIVPAVKLLRHPTDALVTPVDSFGFEKGPANVFEGSDREVRGDYDVEAHHKNDDNVEVLTGDDDMFRNDAPMQKMYGSKTDLHTVSDSNLDKNKIDARKARGERKFIERVSSMGNNFRGLDMNNNGIDDVDEIKEMIEDYFTPDAKGKVVILDWITIVTVAVGVYYRVLYVNLALEIHDFFLHLNSDESYNRFMANIVDDFEELDHIVGNIRIVALCIIIIALVQFFRYLSFDRRFAIVTHTIVSSTADLYPVLGIFTVVCISYAVMGTAIYGQDLTEFADLGSSLSSLFLMILGEFEGYYNSEYFSCLKLKHLMIYVPYVFILVCELILARLMSYLDE
jgi:hypothetical protein